MASMTNYLSLTKVFLKNLKMSQSNNKKARRMFTFLLIFTVVFILIPFLLIILCFPDSCSLVSCSPALCSRLASHPVALLMMLHRCQALPVPLPEVLPCACGKLSGCRTQVIYSHIFSIQHGRGRIGRTTQGGSSAVRCARVSFARACVAPVSQAECLY